MKWIKFSDKKPRKGSAIIVLLYDPIGTCTAGIYRGNYTLREGIRETLVSVYPEDYWMPLPEKPKE